MTRILAAAAFIAILGTANPASAGVTTPTPGQVQTRQVYAPVTMTCWTYQRTHMVTLNRWGRWHLVSSTYGASC